MGVLRSSAQSLQDDVLTTDSLFRDIRLKALVQEALQNNTDLRMASLNITQAEALMKSARLTYLPSFALSPSGTLSKMQGAAATKSYTFPLTMAWELSLGGRQKGEKQMARANWMQAQQQVKYQQVLLTADVCNAYYTLIMLDRQYVLTQQSIRNQESSLAAIRAFREVGKMDELAVNQADAALQETKASLVELALQRSKVETSLQLLLGREVIALDNGTVAQEAARSLPRSTWNEAVLFGMDPAQSIHLESLASRPDVQSAAAELTAACGNERVALSALYPTLYITADGGWTNNLGEVVNPAKLLLNMIGSLTQPLFARGTLKAQKKVAVAQREQAELNFEKALLLAGGELKDALDECGAARRKQQSRRQQVASSQRAWQNSQDLLAYSQSVTYLDVLTAEASFLAAQLQESADWLEQQQAFINLYKALCPCPSSLKPFPYRFVPEL